MNDDTQKAFEDLIQYLLEKSPATLVDYQNALLANALREVSDLYDQNLKLKAKIEELESDLELAREEIDNLSKTNERRFKVGDIVETLEDYEALPNGTGLSSNYTSPGEGGDASDDSFDDAFWVKRDGKFDNYDQGSFIVDPYYMVDFAKTEAKQRRIISLPSSYVNGV